MNPIDHLVWAAADLDDGMAAIEHMLGVVPLQGGVHPGGGTRNALVSLGGQCYLEIIAPDPRQNALDTPATWMGQLERPGLVTWAVGVRDLDRLLPKARLLGIRTSGVLTMSRKTVGGEVLRWNVLRLSRHGLGPVIPFFIDWLDSHHPSMGNDAACDLNGLSISHPRTEEVLRIFDAFEIDAELNASGRISISARIACPKGQVTLAPADPLPPAWRD
ncbi:MAG TPA: VOC family protein [Alphaproteobacteria bacterium]|nr:VOC family protein [Alphaproteobacteria bacterium]